MPFGISTCWFKAQSNVGTFVLIALDVPTVDHHLLSIYTKDSNVGFAVVPTSLGPGQYAFSNSSGSPTGPVNPNVWTHLVFTQQVNTDGLVKRRALFLNGVECVSSDLEAQIYNPTLAQVGAVSTSIIKYSIY
jgi:hypothetical protein